ncbi:LytTR family DNA-binding domain-containing protein [Albimonas sp. CAU 1670]|uniref:LytTR family DNA-binding domain-containing protein n=1 Tax=Albimonas sp. CAU 1670 TaxID=3032599 RepID=UPI0023DB2CF1|nr:LytTR family DNA-binding domain-containing protein [Albimonas sp. CAU 1670]MDF2231547.1 LytTR family DNA-binding domain-containing protein [Albimonas sp. CAU 1670]
MSWFEDATRRWRQGLSNPRLWVVCFLTAGLFAAIGPAGTAEILGAPGRVAFWSAAMAGAWVATTFALCLAEARLGPRPLVTLLVGVALATPALALLLAPAHASMLQRPFGPGEAALAAPLCALLAAVIVVKTRLALGQPLGFGAVTGEGAARPVPAAAPVAAQAPAEALPAAAYAGPETPGPSAPAAPAPAVEAAPEPAAAPVEGLADEDVIAFAPAPRRGAPALLRRLPHRKRGALLRLSMSDHYVGVATEHGEEMLLMRLSDAIAETAPEEGLKVHRSHWVARRAVRSVEREGDRATLVLTNGERVPVSRTRMRALRDAGWLDDDAPRWLDPAMQTSAPGGR